LNQFAKLNFVEFSYQVLSCNMAYYFNYLDDKLIFLIGIKLQSIFQWDILCGYNKLIFQFRYLFFFNRLLSHHFGQRWASKLVLLYSSAKKSSIFEQTAVKLHTKNLNNHKITQFTTITHRGHTTLNIKVQQW
jgi:hypothetical protein